MELTVIIETEDECKEFIRSPRCCLCYKRQMQFSADRYKKKHMGIHTYTIMTSKLAIAIKETLESLCMALWWSTCKYKVRNFLKKNRE